MRKYGIVILLLLNTVSAVIYLLYGRYRCAHRTEETERGDAPNMTLYVMNTVFWVLCPVVAPLFLLCGELLNRLLFRQSVDLEDVIFSKERVKTFARADEEREKNMVPLEEAIAVSDAESLRALMLNVIRGDIGQSLAAIALALNSEDTETAHYAASVLRDELNDFRSNVQRLVLAIKREDDNFEGYVDALLPYMNEVLVQKVFTEMEQKSFVLMMDEVCELVYNKEKLLLVGRYYEWVSLRLLEIREFKLTEKWCLRSMEEYPERLSSYTCQMKLYFTTQEKDKFFQVMQQLKRSDITIDQETLELIRIFS